MRFAFFLVLAAAVAFFARREGRRWGRYAVSGNSMAPSIPHGAWLVVQWPARVLPGDVVLVRDPREPSRTLLKRIFEVTPDGLDVRGDNREESTDSRHFGPVRPDAVRGRVRFQYWPPRRIPGLPQSAGARHSSRRMPM